MPQIPQYEQRTSPNGAQLGANARGVNVDDSEARALQQVGQAGMGLARTLQAQKQRQDEDDAQAWVAKTMADTRLQWTKHAMDSREAAGPGAADYTPNLLKQYDEYAGTTLQAAPTAKAKAALSQHLDQFRAGLGVDAIQWEAGQRRAWRLNTVSQGIGSAATVVEGDPRQYSGALDEQLQSIDQLQMQPDDKLRLADQARKQISEAAVLGQIQRDPTGALRDLEGVTPVDNTSPQAAIIGAAKDAGVDPRLALAFASIESNFDPKAVPKDKNGKLLSSAHGLFQGLDTTWSEVMGSADRNDVGEQAKFGAKFIASTTASLTKSLGHKPQPWEIYMGHVFGAGGAPAILTAPDDMPVEAALAKVAPRSAAEMASANGLAGMTVGQVKQKWQALTARAMDRVAGMAASGTATKPIESTGGANAAVDALDLQDRLRMRSAAETEVNRRQSLERVTLDQQVHDATAAYTNGQEFPNPPDLDRFVGAYGPAEGSRRFGEFRQTQQLGQDMAGVKNLSFTEQEDLLRRRVPIAGAGYAGDENRFNTLAQAIGETRKLFNADPAAFTIKNSPKVNAAYRELSNALAQPPTSAGGNDALKFLSQQYATIAKAEQQRIGGSQPGFAPKLLPDAYTDYVVQQFNSQGQGGQDAANGIKQLADQWGKNWPEVYGQMSKKLPPTALVIGAGMEQAPAALLAEAGKMKREELLTGLDKTVGNDVGKALTAEFQDFNKTLASQVGGTNTGKVFYDESEKLALMYVRQGESPAKAARHAYTDTVGGKYSFQGTYRIPVGQDIGHVTRGADLALESLAAPDLAVPASSSGLTPEQAGAAYLSALHKNAYWVTTGDESGVSLYANGAAVLRRDGQPVTQTWEDLTKRSRAQPGVFSRLFGAAAAVAPTGGAANTRATP